jgi:oligoribonuclease
MNKNTNLIWVDLEMTGLDVEKENIIEIATVVTDAQLNEIAAGPDLVIHQSDELLNAMDEWNTRQHGKSGLTQAVRDSKITLEQAEQQTLDFLKQHVAPGKSPMCGNTIYMDRKFLAKYMPKLEAFFHYRHIDVSTLKELAKRWQPDAVTKKEENSEHRALSDIRESIEELRHYRRTIMNC